MRKDKNPTCDLRDSRHRGRTCGPHGVCIREVPALKCFKQIRNLGLKIHRHSQFPPTESLGWGCNSFQASNIQRVVLQAHNNDTREERELILLCLDRHANKIVPTDKGNLKPDSTNYLKKRLNIGRHHRGHAKWWPVSLRQVALWPLCALTAAALQSGLRGGRGTDCAHATRGAHRQHF